MERQGHVVVFERPIGWSIVKWDQFRSENNAIYAKENGGGAVVLPAITMKTADGAILMGWLASQRDMLSEDWAIVDYPAPLGGA